MMAPNPFDNQNAQGAACADDEQIYTKVQKEKYRHEGNGNQYYKLN